MDMAKAVSLDPSNPKHALPPGYRVVASPWGYYFETTAFIGDASEDFPTIEAACQKARGHYRRWRGKQRQQQHNTETKA
ncbi:hypothetical protein ACTXK7_16440 [Vreelandella alkaliphila]|uniref:Uncharacterized protein n=2 Tax=Halomonas TaxID=2745 RepID=A0A3D0KGH3_9GAMM|nr:MULTISPECIES: hypothetical protein [unclassified Halomonas]HCA02672.1 hypothetical protein [Halomonas campaniensis]